MQIVLTLGFTFLETLLLNVVAITLTLFILVISRASKSKQEDRVQRIFKMPWAVFFSLLCIYFSSSFILWFQALDTDSFIEVQGFDIQEAGHFLASFPSIFHTPGQTRAINNLYILLIWLAINQLSKILMRTHKRARISQYLSIALLCVFIATQCYSLFNRFSSRPKLLTQVEDNFTAPASLNVHSSTKTPLTVVTYIGESSSKMNMSLYGYFRETTPKLDALSQRDGFIKFDAVYSTHTHTTPSLLQALSVPRPTDANSFDIFSDSRLAITQLLSAAKIHNVWISNQTASGAWNQASKIFSNKATHKVFSTDNPLAGNYDYNLARPFDHVFFTQQIQAIGQQTYQDRQAIFLHSYAGHGPYLKFIPKEFHSRIDDAFSTLSKSAILGRGLIIFGDYKSSIEHYDSTMRYVDSSVTDAFQAVEALQPQQPVVSIYFSDHGESVYTAAGHDSSRFLFEMVAVPFVIIFNDAAKQLYPEKFTQLSALAVNKSYSLEILSPIINYLFDIDVYDSTEKIIASSLNTQKLSPYIVYRNGVNTAIAVNAETLPVNGLKLKKDSTLELEKLATAINAQYPSVSLCLHRANSVALAVRGLTASNCIESDIVISDKKILVNHPPAKATGLQLNFLLTMLEKSQGSIWIDAKNIQNADHCLLLADHLRTRNLAKVLVEFPSNTPFESEGIQECISQLHQQNINTTYYVPTRLAEACVKNLSGDKCQTLELGIINAIEKGIQQISFDQSVYKAIQNMKSLNGVIKNTWFMDYSDMSDLKMLVENDRFNMIILTSKDSPNKN